MYEDEGYEKGGILNFGNFNEGYCAKINTKTPSYSWIFCIETSSEKDAFMATVKKLKIGRQRKKGEFPITQNDNTKQTISQFLNPNLGNTQLLKGDNLGNLGVNFNSTQKITDGYWIVLQDWSQCDRACGGGSSTLHRMCVPPKNGGKNCEGDAIVTKQCNPKPCPEVKSTKELNESKNTTTLQPIIKVLQFSSRPQRYTKCVIKEADLMMHTNPKIIELINNPNFLGKETNENLEIPTRVVMNNRTFTIFSGIEYDSLVLTFNLKDTIFYRMKNKTSCFTLKEREKTVDLCPFGCDNVNKAVDEWDYDFNLFKFQCNSQRDIIKVDTDYDKKLKEMMV